MNEIQIFKNENFGEVRVVEINGNSYFAGKDIAEILGYANPQKAIRDHVDEEDKTLNETFTVNGTMLVLINESGLYSLILSSQMPKAKEFKRWVTSEVLPSIRKTRRYDMTDYTELTPELQMFKQIFDSVVAQQQRVTQIETKVETMQSNLLAEPKDDWRDYANHVLKSAGYLTGEYKEIRELSYKILEERARCLLDRRLDNLRTRALNAGMTKTAIYKLNNLDVIGEDVRLKEIYLGIIRELAVKYGVKAIHENELYPDAVPVQ
jgi:prophage antirepressor-like protein